MGQRFRRGFTAAEKAEFVGSLAAGGVAESDWASVWQAVIVHLLPSGTARWDSSCATASLAIGIDALGTRGDIQGDCGAAASLANSDEPWRLHVEGALGQQAVRRTRYALVKLNDRPDCLLPLSCHCKSIHCTEAE
jgi:hypothetical protein